MGTLKTTEAPTSLSNLDLIVISYLSQLVRSHACSTWQGSRCFLAVLCTPTAYRRRLRVIGMILTFGAITLIAVVCFVLAMLYS